MAVRMKMRTFSFICFVFLLGWQSQTIEGAQQQKTPTGTYELLNYNPISNPQATFVVGNVRLTALTAEVIRVEVCAPGSSCNFENRATIAMVNRNLPVPEGLNGTNNGNQQLFTLTTSQVTVQYRYSQPPSASNNFSLAISASRRDGSASWSFGQTNSNSGNLLGTIRSLDEVGVIALNCTQNAGIMVHDESLHCAWGLVGRQGFALVDDTGNYALTADLAWWDSPNVDALDFYLFLHGTNYKRALRDYVAISGLPAMTPRAAVGIWTTRWYNYAVNDMKRVISEYDSRALPLDIQVIDMNWHMKQLWTGWTPDQSLFPIASDAYDWIHSQGLLLLVNLHDAQGVGFFEQMFPQMAQAMGVSSNPLVTPYIPFSAVNATYMYNLEDIVFGKVIQDGVDYAWIDWQQGNAQTLGNGQNPTIILAKVRATDYLRWNQNVRGMVLSRFGGYGAQRYPVGFSGDVADLSWSDLAFQPYFSLTAANVAYTWSHDLVGPHDDYEMMTRWLQWGAYSGVFRSHDRGMSTGGCNYDLALGTPGSCAIVDPWLVPEIYWLAHRACMRDRVALTPYLYTAMREFYSDGLSLLRPMYYEYPLLDSAYLANENGTFAQYFYGSPDMFVSPVVSPSDATQMTSITTWLPPGVWFERDTGVLYTVNNSQGLNLTKYYDISEVPVFIRAGTVIPTIPIPLHSTLGLTRRTYSSLVFTVYPGGTTGTRSVYEDDGLSLDYLQGRSGATTFSYVRNSLQLKASIRSTVTSPYTDQPTSRQWSLIVANSLPPVSVIMTVTATGASTAATFQRFLSSAGGASQSNPTWSYDGESFSLVINLPQLAAPNTDVDVAIEWNQTVSDEAMSGLKGIARHAAIAKTALDLPSITEGSHSIMGGYLNLAVSLPDSLGYWAGNDWSTFNRILSSYRSNTLASAQQEVAGLFPYRPTSLLQLYSQGRFDSCLCGNNLCLEDNSDYQQVLIEGYQAPSNSANAIPLYWYWNANISDNYMTTSSTAPPGYEAAGITGYILSQPSSNPATIPLSVYYHPVYQDHMTVATQAGLQLAQARGYQLLNQTIGYVYASCPSPSGCHPSSQPIPTLLYAETLLASIYV